MIWFPHWRMGHACHWMEGAGMFLGAAQKVCPKCGYYTQVEVHL